MAVRHACRDTAPAENPCAACQSDLSVDRRFFVDTGLAELTGLFVTIVLIVEFEIEITARDPVLAQPKRFITHPVRRDRQSVVSGKSVAVRVDLGGPRNIKKQDQTKKKP